MGKKIWERCPGFKSVGVEIRKGKVVAICDMKKPDEEITEIDKAVCDDLNQHYPVYTVWLPTAWKASQASSKEPAKFIVKRWGCYAKEFSEEVYVNWLSSL